MKVFPLLNIALFAFLFICCTSPKSTPIITESRINYKLSRRDSLISKLHDYNNLQIEQSKSTLFSPASSENNPCYWIDFAIKYYYIDKFIEYEKKQACNNDVEYLNYASQECNIEVLKYLLEKGVNPNKGNDGLFPLHTVLNSALPSPLNSYSTDDIEYVTIKSKLKTDLYREGVILKLLEYGADPKIKDKFGKTAFDYADTVNNTNFKILLSK